jgi:hypothetical protein
VITLFWAIAATEKKTNTAKKHTLSKCLNCIITEI